MLLSQAIIFILGWPLEWTEIIVIFMPIFIPLLAHFNIDPLFFGLMVALNLQTAFLSPPVAMAAFYLKGVAPPHVTLNQIFAGMLPFMAIQVIAMALLYMWPQIGMWLPIGVVQVSTSPDDSDCIGEDTMNVAFIGLGIMGKPMASICRRPGTRYSCTAAAPESMAPLSEAGCTACAVAGGGRLAGRHHHRHGVGHAGRGAGPVRRQRRRSHGAKPGSVVVDMSTISPTATRGASPKTCRHAASRCSMRRCPAATSARSTPRCRSWSAASPRCSNA